MAGRSVDPFDVFPLQADETGVKGEFVETFRMS